MDHKTHMLVACLVAMIGTAIADTPGEARPEETRPTAASPGPYSEMVRQVQERLHALGFDTGPVNGEFSSKMQAALAQFQLSRAIPASGATDDQTLAELGIERNARQAVPEQQAPQDRGS